MAFNLKNQECLAFHSQNQNLFVCHPRVTLELLWSHSYLTRAALVLLVFQSWCTCVTRVALVLVMLHSCCTCVARVALVLMQ